MYRFSLVKQYWKACNNVCLLFWPSVEHTEESIVSCYRLRNFPTHTCPEKKRKGSACLRDEQFEYIWHERDGQTSDWTTQKTTLNNGRTIESNRIKNRKRIERSDVRPNIYTLIHWVRPAAAAVAEWLWRWCDCCLCSLLLFSSFFLHFSPIFCDV